MKRIHFSIALLHPRYWLVWIGVGLWAAVTNLLPFRMLMLIGGVLGRLAGLLSKRRRLIARKNIAVCFPEKTEVQQRDLLWKIMESTGRGIFDTGIAWFWPSWRIDRIVEVRGMDMLCKAQQDGHGILLFTFHFTSLEVGAAGINRLYPYANCGVYRPHANKVYDYIQRKGRERHAKDLRAVPRGDVRGMVRALRNGSMMIYLPDQDYGHKHSIFVPFFGVEAATVVAPSQLVKMGKAKAFASCVTRREDGRGYSVQIYPEFTDYGLGDEESDATRVNAFLEARIREQPDQYLWVHRRFKSRPDHNDDFYEIEGLRSSKRRQKRRTKAWEQEMQDRQAEKSNKKH